MAGKYSRLCIDKEKLEDWISLWCEENLESSFEIKKEELNQRFRYTIICNCDQIKVDFIYCSQGLYTIQPKVGNNIPLSTQIADSIYERVCNVLSGSPFANGFSLIVSYDDFRVIIDLIQEIEGVILTNYSEQLNEGTAKYYLYRFSGPAGDRVTIKYFLNTNRLQLQGKPLWLFNEIVSMVTENGANERDVVDAHLRYCNVDLEIDDIYEEMEWVLGEKLFRYLSETQKAILSTAFILLKIEIPMPDYSGMVQQALRAYEGFAKKIFAEKGLVCEEGKQLGAFFWRPDKVSAFEMIKEYADKIDDVSVGNLTAIYSYYFKKRHPYSHAGFCDFNTPIIQDRKKADELFYDIVNSMKSWYVCCCEKKD